MENLLIKCIPGLDGDCEPENEIVHIGGENASVAQVLHGIIAILNVVVPPVLWFKVF